MQRLSFALWLTIGFSAVALTATAPAPAQAEVGFRCGGGRLVSVGDHMTEVRSKCGEPDVVSQRVEKRVQRYRVVRWVQGAAEEVTEEREIDVTLDEWLFDLGSQRFSRHVLFENNRVVLVTAGAYGNRRR